MEEDVVSGLFWCRLWLITATAAQESGWVYVYRAVEESGWVYVYMAVEESGWVYVYRAVVEFVEHPQVVLIETCPLQISEHGCNSTW